MAGTVAGGKLAAQTNREKYGADFYRRIGAIGGSKAAPAASLQTANWPVSPESDVVARGVDGVVVGTGDDKALNDDVVGAGGDAGHGGVATPGVGDRRGLRASGGEFKAVVQRAGDADRVARLPRAAHPR